MNRLWRYLGIATVLIAGFFVMNYMQHRFDQSDLNKAITVVRAVRPSAETSQTVEELLAAHYGVANEKIDWQAEIESKWRGTVRVTASIPGHNQKFIWNVDLVRQGVIPISPDALNIKGLEEKVPNN